MKAVMSLCDGAKTRIRVGTEFSEEFYVEVGIHQESVLFPLFAIVVDEITANDRKHVIKGRSDSHLHLV